MATIYEMFDGDNPIAVGTIKELADKFGINETSLRDAYYKNRKVCNLYKIRLKNHDGSNLNKKQKEIIDTEMKLGKSIEDIYNKTGIERRDINAYIESKRPKEHETNLEDKLEKLLSKLNDFEEKFDCLTDERKEPIQTTLSLKALGYEYNKNDDEWQVMDCYGHVIKKIKMSSDRCHISQLNGDKKWSDPCTVTYKIIEAIFDELVKMRGY